ncbi:ABC transporter permease [Desulfoscipio sp. XC116]|uniref:ABC transporter permease n=1 Tax=Desulfoscipio sp. XC116 TaxID=3144975 RepID=UPI00325A8119
MKHFITGSKKYGLVTLLIILAAWEGLSLAYSPVMIPSPQETFIELFSTLGTRDFYLDVLITIGRLLIGIVLAVVVGSAAGFFAAANEGFKNLLNPLINILQAVPPISWLALALIWFGVNGQATIFIIFMAAAPVMIINVMEGIKNIDVKLLHMGRIFGFSKFKILRHIVLPALKAPFKSGLEIIIGLGWKLVIMGEVLSSNSGIGAEITNARLNINTARLFALTIDVVLLYYIFDKGLQSIFKTKYAKSKGDVYDFNT